MQSDLAFLEVKHEDPFKLYHELKEETSKYGQLSHIGPPVMCLATATKDGKISNRNVLIEDVTEDGFIFFTDKRSKKVKQIRSNPQCAATILWGYSKNNSSYSVQIRIEGAVLELSESESRVYYDRKDLFCKIRSYICHQSTVVDWNELKKHHDEMFKEYSEKKKELPMPSYQGAFKIVPDSIEFYYAYDQLIADRVIFIKENKDGKVSWKNMHLCA